MLLRDVKPLLLRRATSFILPAAVAFCMTGLSGNAALAQTSHAFSSSMDGATDGSAAALPAAPSSAAATGAGQADSSYGSRGHSRFSRLTFEAGGGANGPVSDSSSYITWGGNLTLGAGYRIVPHLSVMTEYQFIDDKLPGRIIGETGANGGNAHIWSLTLAPVVDLFPRRNNDIYVTGGGGFYRKVTNFTDPQEVEYCDYYYCSIGTENQVVGHFSSNQGGWNVGAGFTHRVGGIYGDSRMKLFAEVRYLDIMTPAVTSSPNGLGTTTIAADTKLIPITLGVRF